MEMETIEYAKSCLNTLAKSLQIHSEGEVFCCDNPQSSRYYFGAPSMTLSFTRPFSIKNDKFIEAKWYKGFRFISNKSFLSYKELKTIFGCQCQSVRYSEYLNKVDRGIYQPTKTLINFVEQIESMKNNILKEYL